MNHLLTTDGSSLNEHGAGAACLLRGGEGKLLKVNAYLGIQDSLRSELVAGILGLALHLKFFPEKKLKFNSDSKVLVDGVTKHFSNWESSNWVASNGKQLKHTEYWRSLSSLYREIQPELFHISLANGSQLDLLACDRASRWAAKSGKKILLESGAGPKGQLSEREPEIAWHLIDLSYLEDGICSDDIRVEIEKRLEVFVKSDRPRRKLITSL